MLTAIERILFIILLILSLGLSAVTFRRMFKVIGRGTEPIDWAQTLKRWPRGMAVFLGQKTLFKTRPLLGSVHAVVAWGFTLYLAVNVVDIMYGMLPGFHFFEKHWLGFVYRLFVDIFSVLTILGVALFLIRRFIASDQRLSINSPVMLTESAAKGIKRDSLLVGFFIIFHVGFRFLGASVEIALNGTSGMSQPGAALLSFIWNGFPASALIIAEHFCWWMALGLILSFLPYFPYSKHAHLFMGPLNFMVTDRSNSYTALEKMDLEDENIEHFGASLLEHLTQKELLDGYACIMCNRCQDACPAYITGKELSPAALEINKRYYINNKMGALARGKESSEPLSTWMLTEDAVWSCTTCGFCLEVCPVGNEPMVDILRMRQDLVLMESRFPKQAMDVFNKLETYGNPWGLSADEREKWTRDMEVPLLREKKTAEYLYWAGCSGAYDDRGRDISRAVAAILNKAGIDYAILGNEESCTGDSARRMGNEYLFQMMAEKNKETFEKYAVKKIITQCPHCLTTLKNDYAEMGMELEVVHHSQFISNLIKTGKIKPEKTFEDKITFHDACYLGRHEGEYDAPRDVLQSILEQNNKLIEMKRSKNTSFCCGAGGGNMWYETEGERINAERLNEALKTGAKTLATSCNFCMIMMDDARKVIGQDQNIDVIDIAELVAQRL